MSEYVFVDTAYGGVDRRNNVRRLSDVRLNGLSDCYASHGRATADLATWLAEHTNKDGRPTVTGFNGLTWAPDLHLDFDAEGDLPLARTYLLRVLALLEAWGVDLSSVRIFFSGAKGFHLEIPHTLFGGFTPSADFHKRLRRAAKKILGEIPFDTSVYDALRLWRLENSRNAKSGMYKIRLTVAEARAADLDDILALAMQPRNTSGIPEFVHIDDDEWMPVDELVGIWDATVTADEPESRSEQHAPTDEARDRQTSAATAASWPKGGANLVEGESAKERVSRHADYLLPLAGFFARRTSSEHTIALLEAGADQAGDQSFLLGRDWHSEITRMVDGAVDRVERDEEVRGLPSLANHFPGLVKVLNALWPGPTFNFADEDEFSPTPIRLHAVPRSESIHDDVPWPDPIDPRAYYGPLGKLVAAVAPHTEAAPPAIFAHLITAVGCYIGKDVRAYAGDASHPAKLNALVVGPTAAGRKGTARSVSERILAIADAQFASENTTEGASSGEGMVWEVRDPIYKIERVGKGQDARYEQRLVDAGVEDKRRWIVESEFASVLKVAQREGNTLSAMIRRAWDRDDLRTLTKNSPARATGAHISLVGHISRDELLRYLDRSELAGGLINRFLIVASKRSQLLPDGETVPLAALQPFAAHLRTVRAWAEAPRHLRRDDAARDVWHAAYGDLTRERPGIFGAAASRAEAQVLRLSVLYAALDCTESIRTEHLLAALALWRYAEQSARWVFGDAIGDPVADTILAGLRKVGALDRTSISALFGRNVSAGRLTTALGLLLTHGLAAPDRENTGGRSREVWHAV